VWTMQKTQPLLLTHWGPESQICDFMVQGWLTRDANLWF
jgi:hypothetical protein